MCRRYRCSLDVESLAREFQLYGSVQGSAVSNIEMKCLGELDEETRLAAEAVQLKRALTSQPVASATAAAAAAVDLPRNVIVASNLPLSRKCIFCMSVCPVRDLGL